MSTATAVRSKVSIRPFISDEFPNAGLTKHNMVVADGAHHREDLGLVERNGIKCYLTGLNENAPEIIGIKDPEKKEAAIRDIRKTVVFLENTLAGNGNITDEDIDEYAEVDELMEVEEGGKKVMKPTGRKIPKPTGRLNPKFWSKVTMFISQAPDKFDEKKNRIPTFWDKVQLECGNSPVHLDPKNPHDLMLIYAIKAGGFTMVAPSLEAAKNASIEVPKFYLDREEETAEIKTEVKKLRNKAGSLLQRMYDGDAKKLFYVTKLCAMNSLSYAKHTSVDVMYDDCDKYINGETVDRNKKQTAEKFIEYAKSDLAGLRVQAIVRDATEMHLLTFKQDGQLYYNKTNSPMGKGVLDVVKFLENPLNKDVLDHISEEVEAEWDK